MKARVAQEPAVDLGSLMGGQVVQHQVHVQVGGDLTIEVDQELLEFRHAVTGVGLGVDLTGRGVERGEQVGSTVADVVVGGTGRASAQQPKAGLGPL